MNRNRSDAVRIRIADWVRDRAALRSIRDRVFVQEQGVPIDIEWDCHDAAATHVLGEDEAGRAIATGRLDPSGKIGRMAVISTHRGHGTGTRILRMLMELASTAGLDRVYLHAQSHAVPFYQKHGFVISGEPFCEAGIPHSYMSQRLTHDK